MPDRLQDIYNTLEDIQAGGGLGGGEATDVSALASAPTTSVAGSATSVTLKAANPLRRYFSIFNNSTSTLYVAFQATATQASAVVPIEAGGYYEMPKPLYVGDISGIWAAANGNASICEGV